MMGLFSDEMRRDPFPVYDQLRGASPVCGSVPGVSSAIVLSLHFRTHCSITRVNGDPAALTSS